MAKYTFRAPPLGQSRQSSVRWLPGLAPVLILALVGGCAHYEYDIVRPVDLAQHVGPKPVSVRWEPLDYSMVTVDNHLVIRIRNLSPDPIRLLGDRSVISDPQGESHSLRWQTIAPGSYIRLILPPLQPLYGPVGPTIGFGFGFGGGGYWHRGYPYHYGWFYDDPYWFEPRYYTVYDDGEGSYWRWKGGSVRLLLVYQRDAIARGPSSGPATQPTTGPAVQAPGTPPAIFSHEFVFSQVKE